MNEMDKNRFKWTVNGKADKEAMIVGERYRFTFLTECLIRAEYDPTGEFEDKASQMVFYRELPVPEFTYEKNADGVLCAETPKLTLRYRENAAFAPDTLMVQLKSAPGTLWHYGDKLEQLKGTARTLDGADGEIPLEDGVISRMGIAVIDDSKSLVLSETDGWIEVRKEGTRDFYIFAYGHDYISAVRDLYRITGVPPMLPDYALGNWWSRYHAYTQEEYQNLILRFEEENIPFSVAVIDMDWHIVDIKEELRDPEVSNGWTGYSWNKELFPDYKAFLHFIKEHHLSCALNLHPADGVRKHEDMYPEMAAAMGMDPATGERVRFDILNQDYMKNYFDILHHPYEEDGVDFWWMDWQQGTDYHWIHEPNTVGSRKDPREELDPLWMLNHLHILDISRNGKRPMFFSRYAGLGSHRYPVGFSGDSIVTWRSLAFQPYFTANASNAGYSWWSHDIGGHMGGYRDDELVVRWMQLGVLSPINRLHSSCNLFNGKEPWNLKKELGNIAKEWLRLRHRLFPYIYTMNYRNHTELLPMIQPMYYSYPECEEAYHVPNQYWFGSEMVVAPIVEKADACDNLAMTKVWLPQGEWFDFFRGDCYTGDHKMEIYRAMEEYPIFAKAGAIIPMYPSYEDNRLVNRDEIEIHVFPGKDGAFTLYQDEGEYDRFEQGCFALTKCRLLWGEKKVFSVEAAEGDLSLIPEKRTYHIYMRSLKEQVNFSVKINGEPADFAYTYDKSTHTARISVVAQSTEGITIELLSVANDFVYHNEDVLDRAFDIILHAQTDYNVKEALWKAVCKPTLWNMMVNDSRREHLNNALKEIVWLRGLSKVTVK